MSPDTLTDFFNIPNGTKIGISDFKGEVIFLICTPASKRTPTRSAAIVQLVICSLYNAGGRVYLHKIAVINIHITEWIASFLIFWMPPAGRHHAEYKERRSIFSIALLFFLARFPY